jgi:hypothetical protein
VSPWRKKAGTPKALRHPVGTPLGYYYPMGRVLHDWPAIQAYHDAGHGFVECQKKFGFTHGAWNKAIKSSARRTLGFALGRGQVL